MIVKFQDLPENLKNEKIADRAQYVGPEDMEFVVDDIKNICATLFGIDHRNIHVYYSVDSSDDFVAFECDWEYSPGAVKDIKKEFPQDTNLHSILNDWQQVQRKNFYRLFGNAYCGRSIIRFNTYQDINGHHCFCPDHVSDEIESVLNDLANHFLTMVRNEYEYQTSKEAISQMLEDTEYDVELEELEE